MVCLGAPTYKKHQETEPCEEELEPELGLGEDAQAAEEAEDFETLRQGQRQVQLLQKLSHQSRALCGHLHQHRVYDVQKPAKS